MRGGSKRTGTELFDGSFLAGRSLFLGFVADLLDEGHVHANNSSLDLLGVPLAAASKSLGGVLLVYVAVDHSPVELGWLLLLEEVSLVLGGTEAEELRVLSIGEHGIGMPREESTLASSLMRTDP